MYAGLVRIAWTALFALFIAGGLPSLAQAQDSDDKETKIPEPEDITLDTKDGVLLRCTWYGGSRGKNTVPIIIVHGWEGKRTQFDGLALYLQQLGHAVIVPDLRGHGDSTLQKAAGGETKEIDADKFRINDFAAMVNFDMEAVKSYLMQQNNAGDLNIELLCVVGSEFGALIAMNWAYKDWSWPQLATIKQGQDVKAMALISPEQSFKGLTLRAPMSHPIVRSKLSTLLIVGKNDRSAYSDTKRIYSQLDRYHEDPPKDEIREKKDLFLAEMNTTLQGEKLLTAPGMNVPGMIGQFINLRLVEKAEDFPWKDRSSPFGS